VRTSRTLPARIAMSAGTLGFACPAENAVANKKRPARKNKRFIQSLPNQKTIAVARDPCCLLFLRRRIVYPTTDSYTLSILELTLTQRQETP
jgi:hypothetical protein